MQDVYGELNGGGVGTNIKLKDLVIQSGLQNKNPPYHLNDFLGYGPMEHVVTSDLQDGVGIKVTWDRGSNYNIDKVRIRVFFDPIDTVPSYVGMVDANLEKGEVLVSPKLAAHSYKVEIVAGHMAGQTFQPILSFPTTIVTVAKIPQITTSYVRRCGVPYASTYAQVEFTTKNIDPRLFKSAMPSALKFKSHYKYVNSSGTLTDTDVITTMTQGMTSFKKTLIIKRIHVDTYATIHTTTPNQTISLVSGKSVPIPKAALLCP